jgi:hypothetical protein
MALLPQILLSGMIFPLTSMRGWLSPISIFVAAKW